MIVLFYFTINKQIIFYLIFLSLIIIMKSFIAFKEFNLLNDNFLLVTEDGIYRFNSNFQDKYLINSFDSDIESDMIEYADISKLSDDDGGYIFCKVFKKIYIVSKNADQLIDILTIDDEYLSRTQSSIIPYKFDNNYYCILSYINNQNKLTIYKFKIYFNSTEGNELVANKIIEGNNTRYMDGISCHLIYSSLYQKNLLICFVTNNNDYLLNAIIFDPENMSLLSSNYKYFDLSIKDNDFIRSIITYNKNIFFICRELSGYPLNCQLYDFENNLWSDYVNLGAYFLGVHSNFNIYMTSKNEYIIFYNFDYNKYIIYVYEQNFKEKYYYIYSFNKCETDNSFHNLIFNQDKCYLLINCYSINENETVNMISFSSYEVEEENNIQEDLNDFNVTLFPSLDNNILSSTELKEQKAFSSSYLFTSILNSSIKSILSSSLLNLPNSTFIYSTTFSSTFNNFDGKIIVNCEEDICIGKINKTKEEIGNNLDRIMENITIGNKYLIYGNNYNISIYPINDLTSFKSTFVDFSLCENILRIKNNLTNNETLTFLKIEIDKMNDKALTNQIEYKIYNHKKEALNLSLCENIKLQVHYNIKDNSLLNKSMILYYSELGIDIFNLNDSFFNDICYPFSNSNSDIILKDRTSDIYQNYSLCDNNCEYDFIDIESNTVTCNCEIKKEVNTAVSSPTFNTLVKNIFKDSNIGILKCHDLIFSLKIKLDNIGFWIFLVFSICHIPLYIYYFINGITSILVYCEYKIRNRNEINILNNSFTNKENNLLNNTKIKIKKDKTKLKESLNSIKSKYKSTISRKITDIRKSTNIKSLNRQKQNTKKLLNPNKKKGKINFKKDNKSKDLYSLQKYFKYSNSSISIIKIRRKDDFTNKKFVKVNKDINESKYNLEIYSFENAILYDKRTFWRLYYICLLSQERFLNTFFLKSPLEIKSLRISLFIFNYSCDLALNSFFYSNEKISDKYHYNGNNLRLFLLINNMGISLFSTIVSILIIKFLNVLTHSKRRINKVFNEIKNNSDLKELKYKKNNIKIYSERIYKICNILKIKIAFYIVFESAILLFFFYYVTGFCIVYQKTQIDWLLDSITSVLLSILFKLLYSFFIAILYITSLKKKSKLLFKIALFFIDK